MRRFMPVRRLHVPRAVQPGRPRPPQVLQPEVHPELHPSQPSRPHPQPPHPAPHPPRPHPQPPRPHPHPPHPVPHPPRPHPQPPRPVPPPPPPRPPAPPEVILRDHGPNPYVVNIEDVTLQNANFRTALWTGEWLQLTLMTIPAGESIGLERHPQTDQFLCIESGQGMVQMGDSREQLTFRKPAFENSAVFVPAGTWHNITNIGHTPLKLYSIYAPPEHRHGVVHGTKEAAELDEGH